MKEFLRKEYGPFTGGVWLVVIVGGVGLGLVMRRFMGARGGDSVSPDPTGTTTNPDYGTAPGGLSPAFVGGGSLYNQGEIVAEVVEAINAQQPPAATTDPVVTPTPTPLPAPKPAPAPAPKPAPAPAPAPKPAPSYTTYTVVKGDSLSKIGARFGVPWRTIYDLNRSVIGSNPDLIRPGQKLKIPK